MIDTKDWKNFCIGDLFPFQKVKKFSKKPSSEGSIEFITSSSYNNGVSYYCDEDTISGNCITVSTNGKCFDCFYHKDKIAISTDVEVLYSPHLNEYNGLFICTVLQQEQKKYDFTDKPKKGKVFDTIVKLPAFLKTVPDWDYLTSIGGGIDMSKIDTSNWSNFKVGDLLTCETTKGIANKTNLTEGNIPYITRSAENNGKSGQCGNRKNIVKGNCITIGAEGFTAFYQKNDFVAGNKIYTLRHPKMNEIIGLYLVSILNRLSDKYSFSDARILDKIKEEEILLPVKTIYEPDWDYMEFYMKNVLDKVEIDTKLMKKISTNSNKIAISEWGEFKVGDFLEMQSQIELNPIEVYKNNDTTSKIKYPFYGQSSENNGIIDYYYLGDSLLNNKKSKSSIMIHSNTHLAYYVDTPFYLKDGHGATTIFQNDKLTFYSALYIISVLNSTMYNKFDYTIKATKEKLNNLIIKLPIDSKGNPNWQYMEDYMKNIMNEEKEKLQAFSLI